MLGGAANVARNIIALGGEVLFVGALGDDEAGDLVAGPLVAEDRIEGRFVREAHHPTTTKVRYVCGGQQIMRLDIERPFSLDAQEIQAICDWLAGAADSVSAIVLSDYAKGVLVPALIERVVAIAKARRIPVVVDPKSRDVSRYEGATVLTPERFRGRDDRRNRMRGRRPRRKRCEDFSRASQGRSGRLDPRRRRHDDLRSGRG